MSTPSENTGQPAASALCRWCGDYHPGECFRVKSLEFKDDGCTVHRVEFYEPPETRRVVEYNILGRKRRVELTS